MAQIGSPSAGWYTDPSGQHRARYWDGASWTEQVRDDLTDTAAPGSAAAPSNGAHAMADTVAGVAEAVAAVAVNDVAGGGSEPPLVVDLGSDGAWTPTPGDAAWGADGGGAPWGAGEVPGPGADPFATDPFATDPFATGSFATGPIAVPTSVPPLAGMPDGMSTIGMPPMSTPPDAGTPMGGTPLPPVAPVNPAGPGAAGSFAPTVEVPTTSGVAPSPTPVTGTGPAAGWYPDPAARHQARLWDGFRWTERVADNGFESIDPLPGVHGVGTVDPAVGAWSSELLGTATALGPDGQPLSAGQISLASLPATTEPEAPATKKSSVAPTAKVRIAGVFVLGGAIALLAGSAMAWMQVTGPKVGDEWQATGLDLGDGRITVALAIVLAVLGAGIITGRMARVGGTKVGAMGALVAGAAALAVTAVDIADVADRAARLGVPAGAVSNVGTGLWLAFIGALFAVGGGLMAFANRR